MFVLPAKTTKCILMTIDVLANRLFLYQMLCIVYFYESTIFSWWHFASFRHFAILTKMPEKALKPARILFRHFLVPFSSLHMETVVHVNNNVWHSR